MADAVFEDPDLAALYDLVEGERPDLDPYLSMVVEFGAARVLDLGCGTGTLACRLARRGAAVTAVDPARASLAVARSKPFAEGVHWVLGDASTLLAPPVDLVTMTGNVAQVFLTDNAWAATLGVAGAALVPGGRLVFETRRPERASWRDWTPERTRRSLDVPGLGRIELWTEVLDVRLPLVSFRQHFHSESGTFVRASDSTLRFRTVQEVEATLAAAGFEVEDLRDAPDRPGLELVFVARRPG